MAEQIAIAVRRQQMVAHAAVAAAGSHYGCLDLDLDASEFESFDRNSVPLGFGDDRLESVF